MTYRARITMVALAGTLALPVSARAQSTPADDPPARVARLSYVDGSVSFEPGTVDQWSPARHNRPITTGDNLWVDGGGRAEVRVGRDAIRLAPSTSFQFLRLDDRTTQIRLAQGSAEVRVRSLRGDEVFEVDTPGGAVTLLRPGRYRMDVTPDGDRSIVTARDGSAEVTATGTAFQVRPGQSAVLVGTGSVTYTVGSAIASDAWEQWAVSRDARDDRAISLRYVSGDMTGYEDLDDFGTWRIVPGYGAAWTPSLVDPGWAPYRVGEWTWVDPWGWTWVDDAAWGFAPFHYGRWAYMDAGWSWVPGPIVAAPVYAPALVAFVGGSGWDVSLSFGGGGGVAWFPLGPADPFVPAYAASGTYVRQANVINERITIVDPRSTGGRIARYANRAIPGAVTAVPRYAFAAGRLVSRVAVAVPPRAVASVPVVATAAVAPRLESVLPGATRTAPRPPAATTARRVVTHLTPPASPVSFSAEQHALVAQPGRPLSARDIEGLRPGSRTGPRAVTSAPSRGGPDSRVIAPPPRPSSGARVQVAPARPVGPSAGPSGRARPVPNTAADRARDSLLSRQFDEREQLARRHQADMSSPPASTPPAELMWQHAQQRRDLEDHQRQGRDVISGSSPGGPQPRSSVGGERRATARRPLRGVIRRP